MLSIAIFGATGSIGVSACDVVRRYKERFYVKSFVFGKNVKKAETLIDEFKPKYVGCINRDDALYLKRKFSFIEKVFIGDEIPYLAEYTDYDIFLSAISGSAGLRSSLNALKSSKRVALANKETMVMAGELFNNLAQENGVKILPVDSEHSAIFQVLEGEKNDAIKKIILTASGGPFFLRTKEEFGSITVKDALKHPNWSMGKKITIDSASMANKGLELIEAVHLFGVPESMIDIIIHPQSIIHSMVKFKDNSIKAQLSVPDMKLPIEYAFFYPERENACVDDLDFTKIDKLTFFKPDNEKFPLIEVARYAIREGGYLPLVFNRVNEEAVYAFLENKIKFTDIYFFVEKYVKKYENLAKEKIDLDNVLKIDNEIRQEVKGELF